jgi:hypothetical protein
MYKEGDIVRIKTTSELESLNRKGNRRFTWHRKYPNVIFYGKIINIYHILFSIKIIYPTDIVSYDMSYTNYLYYKYEIKKKLNKKELNELVSCLL